MIEYSDGTGVSPQDLKLLWKKAFGDEDSFIDTFFASGYAPDCCQVGLQDGRLVGMLFWFDCLLEGERLAYIYGVATDPDAQGQGVATGLMENTHSLLRSRGYCGAVLVPGSEQLFRFYEKRGYHVVSFVTEGQVRACGSTELTAIDSKTYMELRNEMMDGSCIRQTGRNQRFLAELADCYRGEGILAAMSRQEPGRCMEYLGDAECLPQVAGGLKLETMSYRMPGQGRPFAMGLFWDGKKQVQQVYFGLAFD